MHVAYVVAESLLRQSGVSQKIESQIHAWEAAGHRVSLFDLSDVPAGERTGWGWLRLSNILMNRVLESEPDIAYIRFTTWTPAMSRLAQACPVVLEINGDDVVELSTRRLPYRLYHRAVRRLALRSSAGIIVPTHELATSPRVGGLARAVHVVPNGINLDRHPAPRTALPTTPRLVFSYTSATGWPGVDLVLELAGLLPDVPIDIVGPKPDSQLPSNVTATGYLTGDEYDAVIARATVGIASLAMFRAGLDEGSTLKVRGYLAAGLPVIIGHHDTDFPDGAPFLLEIPNRADGVRSSIDAIRSFVLAQHERVPRALISHLDSRVKEEARLGFLSRLATATPRSDS